MNGRKPKPNPAMKHRTPVAILAYANVGNEFLSAVEDEIADIQTALKPLCDKDYMEAIPLANTSSEAIFDRFREKQDAVQIFHFAGHANGEQILLESGGRADGLSGLFGLQKNLALVFLNGCHSEEQAKLFLDAGVKVVLATNAKVNDQKAKVFASKFYQFLATSHSILEAYQAASAFLADQSSEYRKATAEDIISYRGAGRNSHEPKLPWRLFVKEGSEHHLDWKLTQETALMYRLREGSQRYYKTLREGRYKYVEIENLLLAEMQGFGNGDKSSLRQTTLFDTRVIISNPDNPSNVMPLEASLTELWKQPEHHHVLLRGEGGAGKTVSILKLWETYIGDASIGTPIPIFIALNEYNRISKDDPASQKDFLLNYIAQRYLGTPLSALSKFERAALHENLKNPLRDNLYIPSILLFLDGLNEVQTDSEGSTRLWVSLQELIHEAKGIQVVMSSRHDTRSFTFAKDFHLVEIQPLHPDRVEAYLQEHNVKTDNLSKDSRERLLTNPMMLTLWATSSELVRQYGDTTEHFEFKKAASSAGEILWNFNEAQLAKYFRDDDIHKTLLVTARLMLKHILPRIGFELERQGLFSCSEEMLHEYIQVAMQDAATEDFLNTFKYFDPYLELLEQELYLGTIQPLEHRKQLEKVKSYLTEKLQMLVEEGEFRFLHQNFRDFFAACHLRNVAEMALVKGELPEEWKVRAFSQDLRILIGEIEGEYKYRLNYSLPNKQWEVNEGSNQTLLYRVLERCRGIFIKEEIGFTIWNILLIWMILRWELTGIDLSRLWLKNINFNGIKLSGKHGKDYLTVNFANSILDGEQLCFKGNSEIPTCICDYPEKATILAGFANGEIKEFDLAIIKCINRTLHSEKCKILTIRPFEDEGFLSVGDDLKINFWSNEFDLIKTIQCQGEGVAKIACLSPNNAKLTIGFKDGKIQEIEILSGHPTGVNANLSKEIDKLSYDELGENIFIVTADRQVIKIECSTAVETVLIQFESIDFQPVEVSPDGKTVFSRNAGNGFIQWDLQTQAQIKSFERSYPIMGPNQLVFSPDNKKFIAPHYCGTYEEWDIGTGLLIRKIYNDSPRDVLACYRQDGKSLITAAHYGTIIETDLLQNRLLGFFKGTEIGVRNSSFFPNDEKLMIGLDNLEAQEWSLTFNKCIQIIDIHPIIGKNVSFEFGLNNPFILAGFWDFQQLIDLDSGRILTTTTANSFDSPVEEAVNIEFKALGFLDHYPVQYPLNFIKADYQEYLDDPASNQTSLYFVSHNLNKTKFSSNKFRKDLIIIWNNNQVEITIVKPEVGMKCQSVDFRHLHPSSHFTEEEKDRLRRYGAIFNDEDERRWKEAVEDA